MRSAALGSVFAFSVFASAFLLFLVQPLVGKRILPWFGGAPAVWTVCLAFYQSALFLGYAYAHLLIRRTSASRQLAVHSALVVAALVALPVLPGDAWRPLEPTSPTSDILAMLGANVALPFLLLASTGPLVQAWFSRLSPEASPYPLYAVSNLGSLLALLAYPFLLEPNLALSDTGNLWAVGFGVAAATGLACAWLTWRARPAIAELPPAEASGHPQEPGAVRIALWLLLSGCAVLLLMGVTNKLCLDLASVPFLWILPLATYLVTLILCFASQRTYRRLPYAVLGLVALAATVGRPLWLPWAALPVRAAITSAQAEIASYCLLLFSVGMLMHGELYRLRPAPRALTTYYLCVAGGGALGGAFVGILAPVLFDEYHELNLGLALAWVLFAASSAQRPAVGSTRAAARYGPAAASALAVAWVAYVGVPVGTSREGMIHHERTFFGVLRVRDRGTAENPQRHLASGNTLHGVQFLGPGGGRRPSSYYGRATAIGLLMATRSPEGSSRIGVIGLGAGTLAAYGRPGDRMRFYEIDPAVVRIARDAGYFSFLAESPAEVAVVLGDGRLSLAREQAGGVAQGFDILVLDAFSSDAIPVHLLTREAFAHYAEALAPDGLIAVHITNRYLELMRLIARQGLDAGLEALRIQTATTPSHQSMHARWILLGRDGDRLRERVSRMAQLLKQMGVPASTLVLTRPRRAELAGIAPWTDDYSDVFSLLAPPRGLADLERKGLD